MHSYDEFTLCNMIAYAEYDPMVVSSWDLFAEVKNSLHRLSVWLAPKFKAASQQDDLTPRSLEKSET